MSTTRLQEVLICFGKRKQSRYRDGQRRRRLWRLNKLNAALANPKLNTENDAEEYGKGHEFATQTFKTSWDVSGTLEKYLSAEIAAWAMAFGLGKVVKSGTTPNFVYTCTPLIPAAGDAAELPYFSFVEQIRPGAGVVLDRMAVGCAVEGWTITVGSGPGRANSKINVEFVGSGKLTEPSAHHDAGRNRGEAPAVRVADAHDQRRRLRHQTRTSSRSKPAGRTTSAWMPASIPAPTSRRRATRPPARSAAGWSSATAQGTLKFVARFEHDSTELTKLKAQTTGTAVIGLSYDANNSLEITWQKVAFATAEIGETDGIVTVAVECTPMYHATNGVISAVAKCGVDAICQ